MAAARYASYRQLEKFKGVLRVLARTGCAPLYLSHAVLRDIAPASGRRPKRFGIAGTSSPLTAKGTAMSYVSAKDGAQIYYKDWGSGPAVTFSHGWPLNSDAWDGQMLFLVQHGYRCIGVDRRGHGRSSQASEHNDMKISRPLSRRSISRKQRLSAIRPAAAKLPAISVVMAPAA
jgi:hypothetical protein